MRSYLKQSTNHSQVAHEQTTSILPYLLMYPHASKFTRHGALTVSLAFPKTWRWRNIIPLLKSEKTTHFLYSFWPQSFTLTLCSHGQNCRHSPTYRAFFAKMNTNRTDRFPFNTMLNRRAAYIPIICYHQWLLWAKTYFSWIQTKEFDTIWGNQILDQLAQWGLHEKMYIFIKIFLANRQFTDHTGQTYGIERQTLNGVL